jgi:hypothetical protein
MPLNEREQRILEEIERQFYQEDPKLAETVANTTLESVSRRWNRVAFVGFVIGFVVMLASFTRWTAVALAGFVLMVVSAGWIAMNLRRRRPDSASQGALSDWFESVRQRWQRDR